MNICIIIKMYCKRSLDSVHAARPQLAHGAPGDHIAIAFPLRAV